MTSTEPTAANGDNPGDAALADALAGEHAVIYGYGMVSAYSPLVVNGLIAEGLHQHRNRRDEVIALLTTRSAIAPVAAAGYQLPIPVNNAEDAAHLAVRMENDAAVAWRAVLEQARNATDRAFAVVALAQSAVLAARWNQVLGSWPITEAFPGSSQ